MGKLMKFRGLQRKVSYFKYHLFAQMSYQHSKTVSNRTLNFPRKTVLRHYNYELHNNKLTTSRHKGESFLMSGIVQEAIKPLRKKIEKSSCHPGF